MNGMHSIEEKFYKSCFTLSEEDILEFDKKDNGPINNVIANISERCFGVNFYDDGTVEMYFIAKPQELKGDIIVLNINDFQYYELLLMFCSMLAQHYDDVDALDAFNTFQTKLRGFLEKSGYFTISSFELKKFEGQDPVFAGYTRKGFKVVDFIDKSEFYRDFFGNNFKQQTSKDREYVYLMVNEESALIKIGYSNNPSYREGTLHSKEPRSEEHTSE